MCDCEKVKSTEEIKTHVNDVFFNPPSPLPNYAYEAVSLVDKTSGIIIPEIIYTNDNQGIANYPFIYDFKTRVRGLDVNVVTNGIYPYRITDATDLDVSANFWILSLNRPEQPPYNNEALSFRSLIKAHYSKDTNTISFVTKYNIPGTDGTPNFEALVQVSKDFFIIFSDGFSIFNGQGIVLIKIQDNHIKVQDIKLSINGKILTDQQYDDLQVSAAFNAKDGIIFVPQQPEQLTDNVYHVSNREIKKLLDGEKTVMKAKPIKITIEKSHALGVKYEGIESMTMYHGNVYGTTEWSTVALIPMTYSKPFTGKINW